MERASIDEAYVDLTKEATERLNSVTEDMCVDQLPNTIVEGWEHECRAMQGIRGHSGIADGGGVMFDDLHCTFGVRLLIV